jgi:ADP-ribose pyrophosphatase YjhB (NUDIX family)
MPHIHELIDYVTSALIVYDGKVLLCNHPRYGKWINIGGHIELDQVPDDAIMREIQEETGLEVELINERPQQPETPGVRPLMVPSFVDVHEANPPHRHVALYYIGKAKTDQFKLSDEHTALRWFSEEDLDDPQYALSPAVKFYCREAMRRVAA